MRLPLLLGATLLLPSGLLAQRPIPLDQLLAAPFTAEMTASPSGGHFAWVVNERGARNVWAASPPEFRARKLTAYSADDGQDITSLAFSSDGASVYYVRGGGANRAGETPNPTSDPAGAEQAIWRVALAGGEPAKVAQGSSPTPSPKGDALAFARRGQIWSVPAGAAAGEKRDPVQLVNARGGAGALRWSPDGSRLAFVSGRGDHAFVGVYDLAAKSLRWMTPTVDTDANPAWSPDGRSLAFTRIPANTRIGLFTAARSSVTPWSIVVADVATGRTREAWKADTGRGSVFRAVVADGQIVWGAGDRLVFPWEKNGWTQLWSVPAAGGRATLLTPGDGEVEYVTATPDASTIVYNSNVGDIDRRDVWRVSAAGGRAPENLTRGADIEWNPAVSSDGRTIAFLRSGARRPAHAAVMPNGTGAARELGSETIPTNFPVAQLVEPQAVMIPAADGMPIPAQLFLPPGLRPGERRPATIFFHGGSRRQMLLGWHYNDYYNKTYAMNQHLASRGYVVLSVNYRSGTGYGLDFREALRYGAGGASEFADVLGAGLWMRSRADVDPDRIGLWGGSYGGFLTAMGLARASDLFAAGVDIHGVHDWNVGIRTFVPTYNRLEMPEFSRTAFESSPMRWIDGWRSPVLVIHGDDDRNVSFAETVALVEALRPRGVEIEQLVFPDEVHGFLRNASWLEAFRASADFFDRKLGAERRSASGR